MNILETDRPSTVDVRAAAELTSLANELTDEADRVDSPEWIRSARRAWHRVPAEVRARIAEFRRDSGPDGVTLLRGLPIGDPLPATPMVYGSTQRATTPSAATLMMVASGLGDPAAYLAEKGGALVQDVVPVPGQERTQSNAGSVRLTFHTENAFHEHRPDFVLLLCLRADHEKVAELRTVCSRRVVDLLSARSRAALLQPQFVTAAPPSFGAGRPEAAPHAVLTGDPDDPGLLVDEAATSPLTDDAARAMAELSEVFETTYRPTMLEPGDLAIVDNRVAVHGRSAFQARYDGNDRWLQRTFVLADLHRSRDHRPNDGHVLVR